MKKLCFPVFLLLALNSLYADGGEKRTASEDHTGQDVVCEKDTSCKKLKLKREESFPLDTDFESKNNYYIALADWYKVNIEDKKECFKKLSQLINETEKSKCVDASKHIIQQLRLIVSAIDSNRFEFLLKFIKENYCCINNENKIGLSYCAYINRFYEIVAVINQLLLRLKLDQKQKNYAKELAQKFYADAKKYSNGPAH